MNNQRLKALIEEVGFVGYGEDAGFYNVPDPAFLNRMDRFTELIIQECANNIKEWCDASDEHTDKEEYWKGYQHGCDDSVAAIMEHFGITPKHHAASEWPREL